MEHRHLCSHHFAAMNPNRFAGPAGTQTHGEYDRDFMSEEVRSPDSVAPGGLAVELAAIVAAVLLQMVAAFQVGLAYGAPWGEHAYGGRAKMVDGRLQLGYRAMSALAVPILLLASWIILAKAELVATDAGWIDWAVWVVFGYLVINTLGNLASSSKIERYGMGAITVASAVATLIVAVGN
jgi:hypothetical protein